LRNPRMQGSAPSTYWRQRLHTRLNRKRHRGSTPTTMMFHNSGGSTPATPSDMGVGTGAGDYMCWDDATKAPTARVSGQDGDDVRMGGGKKDHRAKEICGGLVPLAKPAFPLKKTAPLVSRYGRFLPPFSAASFPDGCKRRRKRPCPALGVPSDHNADKRNACQSKIRKERRSVNFSLSMIFCWILFARHPQGNLKAGFAWGESACGLSWDGKENAPAHGDRSVVSCHKSAR